MEKRGHASCCAWSAVLTLRCLGGYLSPSQPQICLSARPSVRYVVSYPNHTRRTFLDFQYPVRFSFSPLLYPGSPTPWIDTFDTPTPAHHLTWTELAWAGLRPPPTPGHRLCCCALFCDLLCLASHWPAALLSRSFSTAFVSASRNHIPVLLSFRQKTSYWNAPISERPLCLGPLQTLGP